MVPIHATEATREPPLDIGGFVVFGRTDETTQVDCVWLVPNAATTIERVPIPQQRRLEDERRSHFKALADWWREDTGGWSSDTRKFEHEAYRRILDDIGTEAIPFMLEDLASRGTHWYVALQVLTNQDFNSSARGDLKRARKAWLNWGRANHLI